MPSVFRFMGSTLAGQGGWPQLYVPPKLKGQSLNPFLLLPNYLWLQCQGDVCYFPCCSWVIWGCLFSCCGWRAGIAGTASVAPLVLPPPCVPGHPPLDLQIYGILSYFCVLGRGTFIDLWMFYWLYIEGETQRVYLTLPRCYQSFRNFSSLLQFFPLLGMPLIKTSFLIH